MNIQLSKDNMIYSFTDLEGNSYYKFPKDLEMPIERFAKVQEYLTWLHKGVDKEEHRSLLKLGKVSMAAGFKHPEEISTVGWVFTELENRCKMVLHDELFYNIIAAQVVRGDESPGKWNHEIQMQKVEAFKELDSLGDGFFLHIAEYLQSLNLSNTTRDEYNTLMNESLKVRRATAMLLKKLSDK